MNTPVKFELAKLLKEKGFDRKCVSFYDLLSNQQIDNVTSGNYNLTKQSVSIPTIAEVVMWLYEKHKIWVSIGGDCDYKFKFEIHTWKWYEPEKSYRLGHTVLGETFWDCRSKEFSSPTEAYEAAIEYTLKNLI